MSSVPSDQHPEPSVPLTVHVDGDFEPLLPKFMANRKKEVEIMRDAVARLDFETVRKVAHGMKGAGGSYGFDHVTALAAIIEQAAKTGTAATIAAQLAQLGTYLEHVQIVFDE